MDEPIETYEHVVVKGDRPLNMDIIKQIPCPYTDIITEFADVEIFLISVDSLLLEMCAHQYHNWILGGQTIVLCEQIKQFLESLESLNAKFKLVIFAELAPLFQQDSFLAFLHPFILSWLGKSKWASDLEVFASPLDPRWNDYLHQLTPSFMLLALENPPEIVNEHIEFQERFVTLALHLINVAIPIVLFNGFTINFTSVMAYRLSTVPINIDNFNDKMAEKWPQRHTFPKKSPNAELANCKSVAEFWAYVIEKELKKTGETLNNNSDEFQQFAIGALLSALISTELGLKRRYLGVEEEKQKGPSPAANTFRRRLLMCAQMALSVADDESINFPLEDIWDGRMVFSIHRKILAKIEVLPYRVQDKFAKLHDRTGLTVSIPTDEQDKLLDPLSPSKNPTQLLRIDQCELYDVENELLQQYIPELQELIKSHDCRTDFELDFAEAVQKALSWKFNKIDDPLLRKEEKQREKEKREMEDPVMSRRLIKRRQVLSNWYQLFSDSLEGQGGQLLVDFSRIPKLPAVVEESANASNGKEKNTGKPAKGGGGGKKGAGKGGQVLSKKDQILKDSRDKKIKEQVESDRKKIDYVTGIKTNTIGALDDLLRRLDLDESKAVCVYQKCICYADQFTQRLDQYENIDQKREAALGLVESIKTIFVKYFAYLEDQEREKIQHLWDSLGFTGGPGTTKRRLDKSYNLEIDLIYYQLQYGGRMIDILSDPRKDERVSGFAPDAWQRKMLDAVDRDKSALIVAPTSAGKTFVSYYCIEKVLRSSNEHVVVYISPSKSLTNQIVGSVYARFRTKNMSGGKVLYGICTNEIIDNPLNCQVLVTIPDCFEQILLSTDPRCQSFVSRIKYVILDEIHCINQKDTQGVSLGDVWEHIFLLIRCPFLALSATISNIEDMQQWLQTAENLKPVEGTPARQVELITYDERWSELELALQRVRECPKGLQFENDENEFLRGASVASEGNQMEEDEEPATLETPKADEAGRESPVPSEMSTQSKATWGDAVQFFNPFAVYKLEKLKMFGIPADQRLTARQVLELYQMMSGVDQKVKEEFEPRTFFSRGKPVGKESPPEPPIWLSREDLRKLETALKNRFVHWMQEDKNKIDQIFSRLESEVHDEFEKRSKPFNMRNSALYNVMPLIDQLKRKEQIPALCFNDDREICEHLAIRVFNELQKREDAYKSTSEFQRRFNFKAEDKAQKLAKRKRDEEERAARRKDKKRVDEEGNKERHEKEDASSAQDADQFALLRIRMKEELDKFKLFGRWTDETIYNKVVENLGRRADRPSTLKLLRLFERGICFHHDGLSNAERSAVEVLFRRGFLGIVFSTSTLALGMNLPCKTVIFGIDTPKLTPLQFRQMSGRAGRRGFDPAGNVIFSCLPTSKIRRLLTASLATLRGNVPFTAAFLLRLFAYINGEKSGQDKTGVNEQKGKATKKGGQKPGQQLIDSADVRNEAVRIKAVLTLLRAPFVLKTRHRSGDGDKELHHFDKLLKFLTLFNVQLLRRLQLLDEKCSLHGLAQLAVHLSQYEPGNLVFIRMIQKGVLHSHFKKNYDLSHPEQKAAAKDELVCLLAHLFTQKLLPIHAFSGIEEAEAPILPALSEQFAETIESYNREVEDLLLACLQLASLDRQVENPVFALSGRAQDCSRLSDGQINVVQVFHSELQLDDRLMPVKHLQRMDHRGRRIHSNSYAYDFWKNPDPELLLTHNRLTIGERWYLLNDFNKVLTEIANGIKYIAAQKDDLYKLLVKDEFDREGIAAEFNIKFRTAFKMRIYED